MKEKGQALVEFILVLPIIIIILVSLIDIGNIFMEKYNLNNSLETVTTLYQNNQEKQLHAYIAKENLTYAESSSGDMITITIKKNIKITAPVLSNVLGKNYQATASKTIYKDKDGNELEQ